MGAGLLAAIAGAKFPSSVADPAQLAGLVGAGENGATLQQFGKIMHQDGMIWPTF